MDREMRIFPVQLTTRRIGNITRLIHTLAICVSILHRGVLIHPSDNMNPDTLAMVAVKDGELRHFDAEQAFLEVSVDEGIYVKIFEENQTLPGAVGLLNKIYGLVQVKRFWFNKFRNGRTDRVGAIRSEFIRVPQVR